MTEKEQYEKWLESHKTKSNEELKKLLEDCHYNNLDQYENFLSEAYESGLYAGSIYQTLIEREQEQDEDELKKEIKSIQTSFKLWNEEKEIFLKKTNEQLENLLKDCHYDNLNHYDNFLSEAYESGLYAGSIYKTLIEREKAKMFDKAYFEKWRSNTFEVANAPENETKLSDNGICFTSCPEYKSFVIFKEGGFLVKRTDGLYELWIQKDTLVSESRDHLESILYKFLCDEYA